MDRSQPLHAVRLSAPKPITFWISVAIAVIALVVRAMAVTVSGYSLGGYLMGLAFIVLALGVLNKNW